MNISVSDNARLALVLTAAFLVQLPAVFFGFEICDSGNYLVFYDNFFSHPESVQYTFMYYFSGLPGWLLLRLSGGSLVGMRIAGALCNVAVAWMAWTLLPVRRRFVPMLCSVLLLGAGLWGGVLTFSYDTATMLFATISVTLLVKGASGRLRRSALALFFSGAVCGMNAFCRLPNFIDILFVLLIPLAAGERIFSVRSRGMMLRWLIGWLCGVAAVLLFAVAAGHLPSLWSSATSMMQAGAAQSSDSVHSLGHLLRANAHVWAPVLGCAFLFALLLLLAAWRGAGKRRSLVLVLLVSLATLLALSVGFAWVCQYSKMLLFALAVGGIAAAFLVKGSDGRRLRVACVCGFVMIVLLPAGSDGALYGPGPMVLGVLLPASLCAIWYGLGKSAGKVLVLAPAVVLLAADVAGLYDGEIYFDNHPVSRMTAQVSVAHAAGVRTVPENADFYGQMMSDLNRHVQPGDTLMVYGSGPMLNYLSGTLPALGNSWPALFTPPQLRHWLDVSVAPRYVMMLKFQSLGTLDASHPSEYLQGRYIGSDGVERNPDVYHTPEKSAIMWEYIRREGYGKIAEYPSFILYKLPEGVERTGK